MAQYSIKDLENFTQIKAHTLRIWEQRYSLLEPKRTDTNIRYYSDEDLKKILNINLLYSNGLKISKIALLSDHKIMSMAAELLMKNGVNSNDHVDVFIRYIIELNESAIQEKLKALHFELGMEDLYVKVMIPLLQRIGELWQVDTITVTHEHFFSNILREFFIVETGKISSPLKYKGKVVLFLHEHEQHELSLLFYYYLLRKRNYECYYLGQSVPMKDLKTFVEQMNPDYLFTSLIAEVDKDFFKKWLKEICGFIEPQKIFVGGYQVCKYVDLIPTKLNQINNISDIHLK